MLVPSVAGTLLAMQIKAKRPSLQLKKETLQLVTASEWHRGTHRCHETWNGCSAESWCYGCVYTDDEYTCVDCG